MVSGVNSAKVEMKNATVGVPSHLRVYSARSCLRAFAHWFAVGTFACHCGPRGGLCSFCCCICQPWVHAWVCLGHLPLCAPWTLVLLQVLVRCCLGRFGILLFKGATTPSGKSLARFGFALKSRFSECLGRSSICADLSVVLWGIPKGWKFDFRRGASPFERPRGRSGLRLRSAGGMFGASLSCLTNAPSTRASGPTDLKNPSTLGRAVR